MRVLISGGGTGGHVYPAIAIANAIKDKDPSAEILFVGAQGKLEMEKVPAAGYPIKGLWISGFQRKLSLRNLSFPFKLASSLYKARKIIKEFQPDVAVGVGGYASGPILQIACMMKIPTLIQEQNSYPGITNKLLAKDAQKIYVAYDGMDRFFPSEKLVLSGNPIRKDIAQAQNKAKALGEFGLNADKPTLLIVGGSQGARSINKAVEAGLQRLLEAGIQVIWQTGKGYQSAHDKNTPGCNRSEFIRNMAAAYACADVVLARSGASTVSELAVVGKPAVFVPFPFAAEDHQTSNAKAMVDKGAALLVKDADAQEQLINTALELLNSQEKREKMALEMKKLGITDAANRIALDALNLVDKK